MRRRFALGITVVLGTLVVSALGILATLATSDPGRWPSWLRPYHRWAWWAVLALVVAACLLALWERRRQGGGAGTHIMQTGGPGAVQISVAGSKTGSFAVGAGTDPPAAPGAAPGEAGPGDAPPSSPRPADREDQATGIIQSGGTVSIAIVNSEVGAVTVTLTNQPARQPLPRVQGITSEPIGRRRKIELLLERLRYQPDRRPAVLITGPPGVGKSTLALYVANVLAEHDYRDGQLTVRLRRHAGQPAPDTAALLQTMATVLGHPPAPELAGDREQLEQHYRGAFDDRRVLLLLDGAEDAEQVVALLPPNRCAAIITSQEALPEIARQAMILPVHLDTLSLWSSLGFLDQRIGRQRLARAPLAALALARACEGFPLALAAVSSGFTTPSGRFRSVRDAMRLLRRRVADGLPELEAAFALGYEARSRNDQKMLQVLGLVDRLGIHTSEAAAAAGLADAEASQRLGALADASLVQAVGPDRWQVPQLVRHFARRQAARLSQLERDAILDRLARYEEARALARRAPQDPAGARTWLQAGGLDRAAFNRTLEGVAKQLLDLSQAGLENLANLLLELITLEPQHIYGPRTAEEIEDLATTHGRPDLLERVHAWRPLYQASLPVLRPPPAARSEEEPGVWGYGGPRTFTGRRFQPGEQVTVTVDGQHSGSAVADAGGTFSCTVHLPWQPDPPRHAIAIGDAGTTAETSLT